MSDHPSIIQPDPALVRALCEEAGTFIATLAGPVRRVAIEAGGYLVEVEWEPKPSSPAQPVPGAPSALAPAAPLESPAPVPPADESRYAIVAPFVGTIYRCPEPGAPPFVEVGDVVEPDQPVAIIEAMKLMNRILADRRARVTEIVVEEGMVEYNQVLMYLEPLDEST